MTIIRIPTVQFGYLEFQYDSLFPAEAIEEHNRILNLYNGGFGLKPLEFNKVYDQLLNTGELDGDPGIIATEMDAGQQRSINDLKKALKRINK